MPLKREGALRASRRDRRHGLTPPDEELFGPILQVYRVADFDHALDVANATRFGLAGGLISDDPALWARVKNEMRAGVLNWNRPTTGASGAHAVRRARALRFVAPERVLCGRLRRLSGGDAAGREKAQPIAAPGLPQ